MRQRRREKLTAGDAVWLATALLQREQPFSRGFTVKQIEERAKKEHLDTGFRASTIYQHAQLHCVSNRAPNKAKLCMLTEIEGGLRKLYRDGDPVHAERLGHPTLPHRGALSQSQLELLDWYERSNDMTTDEDWNPFADMKGSWVYGPADEYVNQLREGW